MSVHRSARLVRASLVAAALLALLPSSARAETTRSFGAGDRPSGSWRPFAARSPFNKPIPAKPAILPNSREVVAALMSAGPPDDLVTVDTSSARRSVDDSRPVYFSRRGDPVYRVRCAAAGRRCRISGERLRVPAAAKPAAGAERRMTVVDWTTRQEWSFIGVRSKPRRGGILRVRWGDNCSIDGAGRDCGGGAARFGGMAGRIRYEELVTAITNRSAIPHALLITVGCVKPRKHVYPARRGPSASSCPRRRHAPEMGRHFQLDMTDAEIDALPIPEWRKVIARTMATYGGFVGDRAGSRWGFQFESGMSYLSFGQQNPFVQYAEAHPDGIVNANRVYRYNVRDGIPWSTRLRVLDASVSRTAPAQRASTSRPRRKPKPAPTPTPVPEATPTPTPVPEPAPAPEPTPSPEPESASPALFSELNRPPGTWRPFALTSPFNKPIPANPKVYWNSQAMVAKVTGAGPADSLVTIDGTGDSRSADYSRPFYYSKASDPLYTVKCNMYGGACPISGRTVRIPAAAQPAGGTDGHMTVLDQATNTEWSFFRVQSKPSTGGTLLVGWGSTCSSLGDGRGCGGGAAQFGGMAGRIRYEELMTAIANRSAIPHALFMTVGCSKPGGFVYPAVKDEPKQNCSDTTNAPEMGRHFQLNMTDAEINALPIPEWRKVIARTMARYGAFVGDQGGSHWGFQFESGMSYLSFGQRNPFVEHAKAHPDGTVNANGVYYYKIRDGIPWSTRLRVLDHTVSQGT